MASNSKIDLATSLEKFVQLCAEHGLLEPPSNLGPNDVADGFNDKATLL
jgi:hypothetical protein